MKHYKNKGFTLLEVLTATAILVMLSVGVLKIYTQVLETWDRASKRISSETEISLALDTIEEDIETAFPHFWIYNEVHSEGVIKNIRLCFVKQGPGDAWNALAYQVGYNKAKNRYGLYRCSIAEKKEIKDKTKLGNLLSPEQLSLKQIMIPSNLLAKNILNFSIKFLYKDIEGNRQWTSDAPFQGLPICAEISLTTSKGQELTRRVPFMVNYVL